MVEPFEVVDDQFLVLTSKETVFSLCFLIAYLDTCQPSIIHASATSQSRICYKANRTSGEVYGHHHTTCCCRDGFWRWWVCWYTSNTRRTEFQLKHFFGFLKKLYFVHLLYQNRFFLILWKSYSIFSLGGYVPKEVDELCNELIETILIFNDCWWIYFAFLVIWSHIWRNIMVTHGCWIASICNRRI